MEVKKYERNFLLELRNNPLSLKVPLLPYVSFILRKKKKQRGQDNIKVSGDLELQDDKLNIVRTSSVVNESLWIVCPLPAKGNPAEQHTFIFTPTGKKKLKKIEWKVQKIPK